jgi:hypothetical protein
LDIDVVVFGLPTPVRRGRLYAPHPNIMGDVAVAWFQQIPPLGDQGTQKRPQRRVFFANLMGDENVVDYDDDDSHDDKDNKDDDDGDEDEDDDDDNATINCWQKLGRMIREKETTTMTMTKTMSTVGRCTHDCTVLFI